MSSDRRRLLRLTLLVTLLVVVWAPILAGASSATATRGAGSVVLGRVILPAADNPQGEFVWSRLEDGTHRAQTLLFTTSPRRALQKLRRKELARWPAEVPPDAVRYVELLERLRTQAWDGERTALLIEVDWSPSGSRRPTCRVSVPTVLTRPADLEAPEFRGFAFEPGPAIEQFEVTSEYAVDSLRVQVDEAFGQGTWARRDEPVRPRSPEQSRSTVTNGAR